jgi:hypothetical protein
MRANEFIKEEAFGTAQRRTQRPGARPSRGHNPVPTYKDMTEMDKSQTPPGRDGGDPDAGKKQYTGKAMTSKEMQDRALEKLKQTLSKPENMAVLKRLKTKESIAEEIARIEAELAEHGPTSRKLCVSNVSDESLGASALASCKSQGLRARDGKKSHLIGHGASKVRITVGGKKIKGKAHGGPLPDYGTRKGQ